MLSCPRCQKLRVPGLSFPARTPTGRVPDNLTLGIREGSPTNRPESSDLLRIGDQKRWERIHGPHSRGLLGPAIRRDDIVHAQVFHELARVILGGIARSRANLRIPFGSPVNVVRGDSHASTAKGTAWRANRTRDHGRLRGQIFWRS